MKQIPYYTKELNVIKNRLHTLHKKAFPELTMYGRYTGSMSGKLLRPTILLAIAKTCAPAKPISQELLDVGFAIELFHQMSLVHDDIIDASLVRRNKKTAQARFGVHQSIVLGDLLFSIAAQTTASLKQRQVRNVITKAITDVSKGQLLQMQARGLYTATKNQYFSIIHKKSAALFEAAATCGALLSNTAYEKSAKEFGLSFGMAYQIIDDLHDLIGNPKKTGKPLGQDIKEKELTLPLLLLHNEYNFKNKSAKQIIHAFAVSKARTETVKQAKQYIVRARRALTKLPQSTYRFELERLIKTLEKNINLT